MFEPRSLKSRAIALVLYFALGVGCATRQMPPLQPGSAAYPEPGGYNQYSVEQEVEIGKQVAAEMDKQLPLLPENGDLTEYVQQLGQKLARQLPSDPPYPYDFKVINQKEINAFALPGGPIRVNVGTITAADNEAELAGVMAHEIAHVYMRHSTHNASRQSLASIPAAIADAILGGGTGGQLARLGLGLGLQTAFLKYSRDAEREADYVGAKIMYDAGYDPHAMAAFFQKLDKEGGRGGPEFLASHPHPGNRAQLVTEAIAQLPPKNYSSASNEFAEAKQLALKEKPYSAEQVAAMQQRRQVEQGAVDESSIVPTGFRLLNHSAFQLQVPENWEVYGNAQSAVTVAPRGGVGENAIAYGVVISGLRPQGRVSVNDASSQLLSMLARSNPGLRAAGRARAVSVNGMPGRIINLIGPSPLVTQSGQRVVERNLLVTVQRRDGSLIWMMFIAPEQHFDELSPYFEQMLNSLRVG